MIREPHGKKDQSQGLSVAEANRRALQLLDSWKAAPLSAEETRVLDDFDEFQAQHPIKFDIPEDS